MGFDQSEQGNSGVYIRLILLAYSTALNVLTHKLCKIQLLEFRGNELVDLEIPEVASSLVVMTMNEDGAKEGVTKGYVDASLNMSTQLLYFQSKRQDQKVVEMSSRGDCY